MRLLVMTILILSSHHESRAHFAFNSTRTYLSLNKNETVEYIRAGFRITKIGNTSRESHSVFVTNIFVSFGASVALECPERETRPWYQSNLRDQFVKVSPGHTNRFSVDKTSGILLIKHFQLADSNAFFCEPNLNSSIFLFNLLLRDEQDLNRPVLVSKTDPLQILVDVELRLKSPPEEISDSKSGLTVFYEWTSWSDCEDCDSLSVRKRWAHCKVRYDGHVNQFLLHLNRSFWPHGWPCHLSINFQFVSIELLAMNVFNDLVEYDKCSVSCADLSLKRARKIVRCFYLDPNSIHQTNRTKKKKEVMDLLVTSELALSQQFLNG
jgi:hypothetical protein